jgi:hypothetical protein
MRTSATRHELFELASRRRRNIEHRAEWPGGEQAVAGPPEHSFARPTLAAEAAQKRRLASPCLAMDQREPTLSAPGDRGKEVSEDAQLIRPLEQIM